MMPAIMSTPHAPAKTLSNRLLTPAVALLAIVLSAATPARAQDDDKAVPDARYEAYDKPVELKGGSTALMWLLTSFLGVLAVSVLFKDAKRSHLD
jgi:hypothetical protein